MKQGKEHLLEAFFLIAFALTSFFPRLSFLPVRIWDEARNANNAVHMLLHGNWLVPYYENVPDMWNTKPPLLIWIQVISMKILGMNEFAIRLPSALAALATVLVIWNFSRRFFNDLRVGALGGAVLITSMGYVQNHSARTGDYDALLVLFMTLYATQYFSFLLHGKRKNYIFTWVFIILAVMTKGIAGLMLLPGLLLFTLFRKKLKMVLLHPVTWAGSLVFLLIAGGYYFGREQINPGYLHAVYNNELGGRYLETLEQHQHPFRYYMDRMKESSFRYWFFWIFPAFTAGFIEKEKTVRMFTVFNFLMAIPFFLIISFAGTKLEWYALPIFPFLALQTGWFIYYLMNRLGTWIRMEIFPALFALLVFAYPVYQVQKYIYDHAEYPWDVEPHQPSYYLQDAIKNNKDLDGLKVCYEGYTGQVQFYVSVLKQKGQEISLLQNTTGLIPGDKVLVNQQLLKERLRTAYAVKILDEKYGCTQYLVLSRYE